MYAAVYHWLHITFLTIPHDQHKFSNNYEAGEVTITLCHHAWLLYINPTCRYVMYHWLYIIFLTFLTIAMYHAISTCFPTTMTLAKSQSCSFTMLIYCTQALLSPLVLYILLTFLTVAMYPMISTHQQSCNHTLPPTLPGDQLFLLSLPSPAESLFDISPLPYNADKECCIQQLQFPNNYICCHWLYPPSVEEEQLCIMHPCWVCSQSYLPPPTMVTHWCQHQVCSSNGIAKV